MNDFDIQEQLDFLEDYLKREMDNIGFDYFVIKPGGLDGSRQRPKVKDSPQTPSASCVGELCNSASDYVPLSQLGSDQSCGDKGAAQSAWSVHSASKKSKAVDIVDPATGEKVRF